MGFVSVSEIGHVYGQLTVLARAGSNSRGHALWTCICSCGQDLIVSGNSLRTGNTRSCGCSRTRHGYSNTRTYSSWYAMLERCRNPSNPSYTSHGKRGIRVCRRWRVFENFVADMGERPAARELDRINNNGNYEPGNCRWATRSENQRHTRSSRYLEFRGQVRIQIEWAELLGLRPGTIAERLRRGWSVERALETSCK